MNIEQTITEYFSKQPEVIAVYLFGSYARNRSRLDSDVDLAILFASNIKPELFYNLEMKYFQELSRKIPKNFDVVNLNRAGELLVYEVFRLGFLIYQRDPVKRLEYQARRICGYLDFSPLMFRMRKGMMKKLREGISHG